MQDSSNFKFVQSQFFYTFDISRQDLTHSLESRLRKAHVDLLSIDLATKSTRGTKKNLFFVPLVFCGQLFLDLFDDSRTISDLLRRHASLMQDREQEIGMGCELG
jgi:hypothetical protein